MSKSKKQLWLERVLEKEKLRQLEKEVKSCAKNYKKSLEKKATSAEKRMWYALKASPLAKVFEFQHIVYIKEKKAIKNLYIVDFCIPIKKIILEIDGDYHFTSDQKIKDFKRSSNLRKLEYRIIRVSNSKVYEGTEPIIKRLIAECNKR